MPIHGTIEEAGLPDVLQLLALGRKTGCLSVSDGSLHGEIYLDVGRVSYASLANRDRLGEMLVRHGRINREQLAAATAEQARGSDRALGRILLQSGAIERADVERYVRLQVEEAVYTLFTWKKGAFTFSSDEKPVRGALPVSLEAESLLLEGARRVDEWSLIEKKIPTFDLVYQRTRPRRNSGGGTGGGSDDLTEDQRRMLPLLDGTRDVAGIAEITGMGDFDVGKALYGLIVAGIVRLVERRAQVRHLEYRELLAYVVREAELADPQRRKMVARHIVDCPTCSERLRTIHVRRTEGKGIPMPSEAEVMAALATDSNLDRTREQGRPADAAQAVTLATPPVDPQKADTIVTAPVERRAPAPVERRAALPKVEARTIEAPVERRAAPIERRAAPPVPRASIPVSDFEPDLDEVEATVAPAPPPPAPPAPQPTPPARERATRELREGRQADRRAGDRRAGTDRRAFDRRAGQDRRQQVNPVWAQMYHERRGGPRRANERPGAHSHDRRSGDRSRRGGQESPRPIERRAPDVVMPMAPLAPPAPPVQQQPSPRRGTPGQERRAEGQPSDLVWLMSPDESMELIRASRSAMRPPPEAGAALPPAQRPSPRQTTSPGAARRSPLPAPAQPHIRHVQYDSADDPEPVEIVRRSGQRARKVPLPQPIPKRNFGIAAMFVLVGLGAYAAGHMGARAGSNVTPLEEAVAATPAESAPQPPASRQPARPAERQPAAETQRAAPTVSAPTRVPAQPQPSAQPNARGNQPAPQQVAQAPAPAPQQQVVAAPPPVVQQPPVTAPAVTNPTPAAAPAASAPAAAPAPAPTAAEPDRELATGGWSTVDRAEAITLMSGGIGVIPGLAIESISRSVTGTRARVRVTQLTADGQRIVLTETRSGATRVGPAVVTAVRVMPASEAYPFSTGTVSLGNLLITAKSSLSAETLQPLLARLSEIQ